MCTGGLCCLLHFLIRRIRASIADIFTNRSGKQVCILQYHGDMASQTLSCIVFNISAIDRDLSFLNVIKTIQKVGNRRFSGAGRTDKCHFLAGMRIQIDVLQDYFIRIVTKGNIFHNYFTFDIGHLYRIRFICLFRLFIHDFEDTLRTGER